MQADEMLAQERPPQSRARAPRRRITRFATREQQAARKHNNPLPYFRLEDTLCRRFLEAATSPTEFEGVKLLFPFERELSVLQIYRKVATIAGRMHLAFIAGYDLGKGHPELLEEVLPGPELRETVVRVGIIKTLSGEVNLSNQGLRSACEKIAKDKWSDVPEAQAEDVLLEATVKSLRAGFAAATVSQGDPEQCEFVWDLPERIGDMMSDIVSRSVVGAPLNAVGQPVTALLEHPLLRMARELYPAQPMECAVVREFLRGRLRALKVKSENECPGSERDLADWIAAGLEYGRRVRSEHPETVRTIFAQARGKRLDDAFSVVRRVVAEAGDTDPTRLLGSLKCWQESLYGWSEPGFYGQELARVVYFSDFAVWIPWVFPE